MSIFGFPEQVGLKEFEADRILAEGRRQTAIAEATAAGGGHVGEKVKAADREYFRAVAASAQTHGLEAAGFLQTLRELGG
jgi:hypothetical protein